MDDVTLKNRIHRKDTYRISLLILPVKGHLETYRSYENKYVNYVYGINIRINRLIKLNSNWKLKCNKIFIVESIEWRKYLEKLKRINWRIKK